jgi:uncharacterized protein (TIGR00299 family) protein
MILFADMVGGAAGDMILSAMLDCGLPLEHLQKELGKLNLPQFRLSVDKVTREGVECAQFNIYHPEEHHHRTFRKIKELIEKSQLSDWVKTASIKVFHRLAEVESQVHHQSLADVHFHEVGALDSIIDIVGAMVGMEYFKAEGFYLSDFLFGRGMVECQHGILPIPAPATALLTKGFSCRRTEIQGELTTPTAAAILTSFSLGKIDNISFTPKAVGCGAGKRIHQGLPSYFRLWMLEITEEDKSMEYEIVVEANIDDMNSELYPYLMDKLFSAGAKDVFFTSIIMKKGRLGTLITITADENLLVNIGEILFKHSSTIGLRWRKVNRWKLPRTEVFVDTQLGKVKAKQVQIGSEIRIYPEYEECKALAEKHNLPLAEIYSMVSSPRSET